MSVRLGSFLLETKRLGALKAFTILNYVALVSLSVFWYGNRKPHGKVEPGTRWLIGSFFQY